MEKHHTDHLIKDYGFNPFQCEGEWRDDACLDHLELRVNPVKVIGFYPRGYSQRVILDTRTQDAIPFDYIYTYIERLSEETVKKINIEEQRLADIAFAEREEREKLKIKGTRVRIHSTGFDSFKESDGTVYGLDDSGKIIVKSDLGGFVHVFISALTKI